MPNQHPDARPGTPDLARLRRHLPELLQHFVPDPSPQPARPTGPDIPERLGTEGAR